MNHKTDMQASFDSYYAENWPLCKASIEKGTASEEIVGEREALWDAWQDAWKAALAGHSAGDPIYQIAFSDEDGWCDTHKKIFDEHPDHMRRIVYTAPVAVSQSAGVPTGYVLVPIEPTVEMKIAGDNAAFWCGEKWKAMLGAAPAPVSEPSPDSEQVGFIEAAVTKLAADFARIGEAFMDLCSELGCPDNTNMLDWARGRMTCDACYGTGRVFVGNSGREGDGNAPEFERCPSCGYGDAAPSRECGARQGAALSDEQARTIECADSWLRMRGLQTYTDLSDTLFAVLRSIGYTEEFAEAHLDLKVSEGVKLFLAASAPTLCEQQWPSDHDAAIQACALMILGICKMEPQEVWPKRIEGRIRYMLSKLQPQAAEPNGMTDERIDEIWDSVPWKDLDVNSLEHVKVLRRRFARALLAKGGE